MLPILLGDSPEGHGGWLDGWIVVAQRNFILGGCQNLVTLYIMYAASSQDGEFFLTAYLGFLGSYGCFI